MTVNLPPKNGRGHTGLLAGGSCREVCKRHKVRINPKQKRYDSGLKYCSYCEVWLKVDCNCCMCCGRKLRHNRRYQKIAKRGDFSS
ncbi:hypothetical protein [Nitrosopumilus sp.]|uniref:hypothetical protein n=1 Tax=Nitrosopumilus sp. TaxID=2024843 RepID=UPI00292F49E9|nr:hypothetical protein [Nitrosopumilus sp.]